MRYPAAWWHDIWRDGLAGGNGRVGADVYGGVKDMTVMLTHHALWHCGHANELPDVGAAFAEDGIRVLPFRQRDDIHRKSLSMKDRHRADGRLAACPVGIERQFSRRWIGMSSVLQEVNADRSKTATAMSLIRTARPVLGAIVFTNLAFLPKKSKKQVKYHYCSASTLDSLKSEGV